MREKRAREKRAREKRAKEKRARAKRAREKERKTERDRDKPRGSRGLHRETTATTSAMIVDHCLRKAKREQE